ncbi:MAG TPA: GNAT family N-acetyltransferase [Kaistella sp.]|nr:GNAT family N-acetyltransferase [Kaistella sp.]
MGEIKVRKITSVDLTDLVKISRQTFNETFEEVNSEEDMQKYLSENLSEEQLQSELDNPESEFYFAENKDEILGYLKLNSGNSQTENKNENSIEIERIYVLKKFLRMKIGQLLLDHSIQIAKEKNAEFIWLGVWEHNERALKFYGKNGFEVYSKHDFVLGKDVQTDLLMKMNL